MIHLAEATGQMTNNASIRIFVSSPGDLGPERLQVITVCRRLAVATGTNVEPLLWEGGGPENPDVPAFPPYMTGEGPQQAIDTRVWSELGGCDIYLGMIWTRMGTPSGEWRSGTEAEYRRAREFSERSGRPSTILFYRKYPPKRSTQGNRSQRQLTLEFCHELEQDGLLQRFGDMQELERHLYDHLTPLMKLANSSARPVHRLRGSGIPLPLGDTFVGRTRDMDALAEALDSAQRIVVIGGSPGVGKTRIAAEFAHVAANAIYWTAGDGRCTDVLRRLGRLLNVTDLDGDDESVAVDVTTALTKLETPATWIIDNLVDLDVVNQLSYLTSGQLRLLITTRDLRKHLLPPTATYLELAVLDPGAAAVLLSSRSDATHPDPDLIRLAATVGNLPLALELLAVRLAMPRQTPAGLLELTSRSDPLTPLEGLTIPRAQGVFETISASLTALSRDVRRMLAPLGYIADAPLTDELALALTGLNDEQYATLLQACQQFALISVGGTRITIHSLTTSTIAATNPPLALDFAVNRAFHRLLAINLPPQLPLIREDLAHVERVLAHAVNAWTQTSLTAERAVALGFLGSQVAVAYYAMGRVEEGVALNEDALRLLEPRLPSNEPDLLWCRNNLGGAYQMLGRLTDAMTQLGIVVDERTRTLGPTHPDTLAVAGNMALLLSKLGATSEAVRRYCRVLRNQRTILGPHHTNTLTTSLNLCLTLFQRGWTRRAITWLTALNEAIQSSLPDDNHLLPMAQSELAMMHLKMGDGLLAVNTFQLAQSNFERIFGATHHNSIQNKGFIASALIVQGDLMQARATLEQVLAELPAAGYNAGWRIGFEYHLALTYFESGDLQTAAALLDDLLPRAITTNGKGDDITLRIGRMLEQSFMQLKRYPDVIRIVQIMSSI